jgi:hypothetical protein
MSEYESADAAIARAVRILVASGHDAGIVADALATNTIALLAAHTGRDGSRLIAVWHSLREFSE